MAQIDYNALGQAIDETWGRSSTPKTASYSVKVTLAGQDRLHVSYAAIVNFSSERQMIDSKRAYSEEARSIVSEVIKKIKNLYKDITGNSLKVKVVDGSETDSVEIINMNVHTAKRTAYYRHKAFLEVG